jgi:hypothetical protein
MARLSLILKTKLPAKRLPKDSEIDDIDGEPILAKLKRSKENMLYPTIYFHKYGPVRTRNVCRLIGIATMRKCCLQQALKRLLSG